MNSDLTTNNPAEFSFSNTGVDPHQLPDVADIEFTPITARYRQILILYAAVFGLVVAVAATIAALSISELGTAYLLFGPAAGILVFGLRMFLIYKGFPLKGYALRERDIAYRTGWLWRSVTLVPFGRIQHGELSQGFVERLFGLQKLKIYTAGGSRSDLVIPGLPADRAERIRAHVMERVIQEIEKEDEIDHPGQGPDETTRP